MSRMPQDIGREPLSVVLDDLSRGETLQISVDELTVRFGGRALGALLFMFSLACLLPLPPGATTILGLPLVLLAPQLLFGTGAPWLPRAVRERQIATADLRNGLPRLLPWLRRIEAVSKPRLAGLFGPVGRRIIGLVCSLLALVLILPIPLGNMLPALAVSVLSFSLIQRDGVIALIGLAIAAASAGVLALAAHIVVKALQQLVAVFAFA
jgi:hypothetical protein